VLVYRKDWVHAGEIAYEVLEGGNDSPYVMPLILDAIRMHARVTGDWQRALTAVEETSHVEWNAAGSPTLTATTPLRDAEVAYADLLLHGGDAARGRVLLDAILSRMHHDLDDLHRPVYWYLHWHPVALALAGQREAALAMLERSNSEGLLVDEWWWFDESEPAFESMRSDPRFLALKKQMAERVKQQRERLAKARADGLVPDRTAH
jgi:hypothetical protein